MRSDLGSFVSKSELQNDEGLAGAISKNVWKGEMEIMRRIKAAVQSRRSLQGALIPNLKD